MTVKNEKAWYVGKTDSEVLNVLEGFANRVIEYYEKGKMNTSEQFYTAFYELFDSIVEFIVDEKSFWYDSECLQFERFDSLHFEVDTIKCNLEDTLMTLFVKNMEK